MSEVIPYNKLHSSREGPIHHTLFLTDRISSYRRSAVQTESLKNVRINHKSHTNSEALVCSIQLIVTEAAW
jgi:hypothetical protein